MLQITLYRIDKGLCNTVGNLCGITFFQTLTAFPCLFQIFSCPPLRLKDKFIADGASRHSHGTFYNPYILFFSLNIRLLICFAGIAFISGDKPGSGLHSVQAQFQRMPQIFSFIDSACGHHGNMALILFAICLNHFHNALYLLLIGLFCYGFQLLPGKPKMTSCSGSFNYHKIRAASVLSVPEPADNGGCLHRGHNGSDFRSGSLHQRRQNCGKPGSGNNQICSCFYGSPNIFPVFSGSHHNVYAYHATLCQFSGLMDVFCQSFQIGLNGGLVKSPLLVANLCCGNNAHASAACHSSRQPGKADAYAHTSLDDRNGHFQITDFKCSAHGYILRNLS